MVRFKGEQVDLDSHYVQTNIQCEPHFVPEGEAASVKEDDESQTAISATPSASISAIVPELRKLSKELRDGDDIIQLTKETSMQFKMGTEGETKSSDNIVGQEMMKLLFIAVRTGKKPGEEGDETQTQDDEEEEVTDEEEEEKGEGEGEGENQKEDEKIDIEVQTEILVRPFFIPPDQKANVVGEKSTQTGIRCVSTSKAKLYPQLQCRPPKILKSDKVIDIPDYYLSMPSPRKLRDEFFTSMHTNIFGFPAVTDTELKTSIDMEKPGFGDDHLAQDVLNIAVNEALEKAIKRESRKIEPPQTFYNENIENSIEELNDVMSRLIGQLASGDECLIDESESITAIRVMINNLAPELMPNATFNNLPVTPLLDMVDDMLQIASQQNTDGSKYPFTVGRDYATGVKRNTKIQFSMKQRIYNTGKEVVNIEEKLNQAWQQDECTCPPILALPWYDEGKPPKTPLTKQEKLNISELVDGLISFLDKDPNEEADAELAQKTVGMYTADKLEMPIAIISPLPDALDRINEDTIREISGPGSGLDKGVHKAYMGDESSSEEEEEEGEEERDDEGGDESEDKGGNESGSGGKKEDDKDNNDSGGKGPCPPPQPGYKPPSAGPCHATIRPCKMKTSGACPAAIKPCQPRLCMGIQTDITLGNRIQSKSISSMQEDVSSSSSSDNVISCIGTCTKGSQKSTKDVEILLKIQSNSKNFVATWPIQPHDIPTPSGGTPRQKVSPTTSNASGLPPHKSPGLCTVNIDSQKNKYSPVGSNISAISGLSAFATDTDRSSIIRIKQCVDMGKLVDGSALFSVNPADIKKCAKMSKSRSSDACHCRRPVTPIYSCPALKKKEPECDCIEEPEIHPFKYTTPINEGNESGGIPRTCYCTTVKYPRVDTLEIARQQFEEELGPLKKALVAIQDKVRELQINEKINCTCGGNVVNIRFPKPKRACFCGKKTTNGLKCDFNLDEDSSRSRSRKGTRTTGPCSCCEGESRTTRTKSITSASTRCEGRNTLQENTAPYSDTGRVSSLFESNRLRSLATDKKGHSQAPKRNLSELARKHAFYSVAVSHYMNSSSPECQPCVCRSSISIINAGPGRSPRPAKSPCKRLPCEMPVRSGQPVTSTPEEIGWSDDEDDYSGTDTASTVGTSRSQTSGSPARSSTSTTTLKVRLKSRPHR